MKKEEYMCRDWLKDVKSLVSTYSLAVSWGLKIVLCSCWSLFYILCPVLPVFLDSPFFMSNWVKAKTIINRNKTGNQNEQNSDRLKLKTCWCQDITDTSLLERRWPRSRSSSANRGSSEYSCFPLYSLCNREQTCLCKGKESRIRPPKWITFSNGIVLKLIWLKSPY